MARRTILTPCPARKQCRICNARLNEVFGSAEEDRIKKFLHCAGQAGEEAKRLLSRDLERAIVLVRRAADWAEEAQKAGYLVQA